MRIVIDGQPLQNESKYRGIGRYIKNTLRELAKIKNSSDEIFVILNSTFDDVDKVKQELESINIDKVFVLTLNGPLEYENENNLFRREKARIIYENFIESLEPDVYLIFHYFEGYNDNSITLIPKYVPTAVIIHDLIPLVFREDYLEPNHKFKKFYLDKLEEVKKANLFFTISEHSKKEISEYLDIIEDDIINISAGRDPLFRKININKVEEQFIKNKYNITNNFILYIGGSDKRKNIENLIRAYSQLESTLKNKYQLVLIGRMPPNDINNFKRIAKETLIKNDQILFLNYIESDEDLVKLLNIASLFVFPSLSEGFGLPILECFATQTPVICSNRTALKELLDLPFATFDPTSVRDIRDKITNVLKNKDLQKQIIVYGLKKLLNYTFENTAKKLYNNLKRLSKTERIFISSQPEFCQYIFISDNTKRNFFIDVSHVAITDNRTGIQRVTRSVLYNILKRFKELDEFNLIPVQAKEGIVGYTKAKKYINETINCFNLEATDNEPITYKENDIFFGLDFHPNLIITNEHYLRSMKSKGVKIYFYVHDLLPVRHPEWFLPGTKLQHENYLRTIYNFDGAICNSKTTAIDLIKYYKDSWNFSKLGKFAIGYSHLGYDIENSIPSRGLPRNAKDVIKKLKNKINFLLVSTIEPRKGHELVLNTFEELWRKYNNINLIFVGKNGWMMDKFIERIKNHKFLNEKFFWLESISDEYLDKIYNLATAVIVSSKDEGYGLSLVEAAKYKKNLIVRDIPVFREIAENNAFYFENREDHFMLARKIEEWLDLYKNNKVIKSDKFKLYTWDDVTDKILNMLIENKGWYQII